MGNFVTTGDREHERRVVASITRSAGEVFTQHFRGRGAGYEEMLDEQWRLFGGEHPLCWAVSEGLGNSEHLDADDSHSHAVWVARHGHASQSGSWWLLFPRHGEEPAATYRSQGRRARVRTDRTVDEANQTSHAIPVFIVIKPFKTCVHLTNWHAHNAATLERNELRYGMCACRLGAGLRLQRACDG